MKAWQHAANEWADATCNALQWVKNIREGISTPDEAITAILSDIDHARSEQPSTVSSGHCTQGGRCVCGGDLQRVREGCANWVTPNANLSGRGDALTTK